MTDHRTEAARLLAPAAPDPIDVVARLLAQAKDLREALEIVKEDRAKWVQVAAEHLSSRSSTGWPLDADGLRLGAEVVIMPRRDSLNVAAIRRAHGVSGVPCVRRIDKRWQPLDGFGAIMSSDAFNADREGYDTKAGAVEALNGLLAASAVAA